MNVQTKPTASVGAGTRFSHSAHDDPRVRSREIDRLLHAPLGHAACCAARTIPAASSRWPSSAMATKSSEAVIELTHNWGQKTPYEIGSGFGHLAIGVPDIYGTCDGARQGRRQDPAPARPDEAWRQRHRLRRGSRRLQDRIDRTEVAKRGPDGPLLLIATEPLSTCADLLAHSAAGASRCRAGAGGRCAATDPRSFPSTGRPSRPCARGRTAR